MALSAADSCATGIPTILTARRPAMGQDRFHSHCQRHELDFLRYLAKTLPTRHRRFDRALSDGSAASQCRPPGAT